MKVKKAMQGLSIERKRQAMEDFEVALKNVAPVVFEDSELFETITSSIALGAA
jgi:hypothetical protein